MDIPFSVYYDREFLYATSPTYQPDFFKVATGIAQGDPLKPQPILAGLFEAMNGMPSDLDFTIIPEASFRSMSVGDVVVIGENAWRCQNVGWCEMDSSHLPRESMNG